MASPGIAVVARPTTYEPWTYVMCYAWNLMGPDLLLLQRMVGVALGQKVLETSHILQAEEGYLVVRLLHVSAQFAMPATCRMNRRSPLETYLMGNLGRGGIFALQACLKTVAAGWMCLLALQRSTCSNCRISLLCPANGYRCVALRLYLDAPPLAVVASPAALGVASPL